MPVTSSARKALRRDRKRAAVNAPLRTKLTRVVRTALEEPSSETLSAAFSVIDRAAKKRVIHSNRAARLKSRLVKSAKGK